MPPLVRRKARRLIPSLREAASAARSIRHSTRACSGVCGKGLNSSFETIRVGIGEPDVNPWVIPGRTVNRFRFTRVIGVPSSKPIHYQDAMAVRAPSYTQKNRQGKRVLLGVFESSWLALWTNTTERRRHEESVALAQGVGVEAIVLRRVKEGCGLVADEALIRVAQTDGALGRARVDVDTDQAVTAPLKVRVEIHPSAAQRCQLLPASGEARQRLEPRGGVDTVEQTLLHVNRGCRHVDRRAGRQAFTRGLCQRTRAREDAEGREAIAQVVL